MKSMRLFIRRYPPACRRYLLLILLFGLSYASAYVYAAPVNIYQVELIIFSHLTETALNSEQWPRLQGNEINNTNTVSLKPVNGSGSYFTLLPSHDFQLTQEQKNLHHNPNYHTLLHLAWRQPIYEPRYSQGVQIHGNTVNGTLKLSVRRYFDLTIDLLFASSDKYFRLQQSRRMRSNELNYIDFPLYGVLKIG